MSAPSVYAAINAVTAELAMTGIAKNRSNELDGYKYRSIDDVLDKLAPLLAKHRLCVLPRATERLVSERDERNGPIFHVALRVSFTLISVDDGSREVVESYGEALDDGDKATAKAMSAAYKAAMVQTFCIPVLGMEDADATSLKRLSKSHIPEPVQGWDQWSRDIAEIVCSCESEQAIGIVQERNRGLLKALSREHPEMYEQLGRSFISRREELGNSKLTKKRGSRSRSAQPTACGMMAQRAAS